MCILRYPADGYPLFLLVGLFAIIILVGCLYALKNRSRVGGLWPLPCISSPTFSAIRPILGAISVCRHRNGKIDGL